MRGYLVRPAKAAVSCRPSLVDARKSRPEPAHRRHRAPAGARQLRGVCARCAVPARRLSRATRTRRASSSQARSAKTREDFVARRAWLRQASERNRQGRRRRLLLRRRHRQHARDTRARSRRRRRVLRRRARLSRTCRNQAALLIQSARGRRAHQRELAGVRSGAEGGQGAATRRPLPGHAARIQQRHDAALRRDGRQARVGADPAFFNKQLRADAQSYCRFLAVGMLD